MTARGTVVIPAHDEAAVLGRTLSALAPVARSGELRVVVACNGCTDGTEEVARRYEGVEVVVVAEASKAAALRAGDAVAGAGPRVYLDADVVLTGRAAGDLARALRDGAVAGRPPHVFDTTGASWPVRRWYAVRRELPSIAGALWGAGCYAMSETGRARFGQFPDVVSDDLFVDSLFGRDEVAIVETDPLVVTTPRRTADLHRILVRSYRTQGEVRAGGPGMSAGQRGQLGDLLRLLRRRPHRVLDAGVYLGLVGWARLRARGAGRGPGTWERDASSRGLPG